MLPDPGPQFMSNSSYSGPQLDMINHSKQIFDPLGGLQKETASHQKSYACLN
jgi:hypothetical protein